MFEALEAVTTQSEDQDTRDVPGVLRAFLEDGTYDQFWDTLDLLDNAFARNEGKPTRIAPIAVPFVYELLAHPRVHGQDVLLVALSSMIGADPSQAMLGYGVDPLYRTANSHLPHVEETVRALLAGTALVASLASSGEPMVRARAIDLLSTIGMAEGAPPTEETPLAVLNEIALRDDNPLLRASALLGVGAVSRAQGRRDVPPAIDVAYDHASPVVRDVARCARAYFELGRLSDPLLADLVALGKRRDVRGEGVVEDDDALFTWNRGRLAEIGIFAIVGSLAYDRKRAMAALFEVLEHRLQDGRWQPPVMVPLTISHMVRLINPMIVEAFGAWHGLDPAALAEKTLDDDQRRLVGLIERYEVWSCIPQLLRDGDLTSMRHVPERVECARQASGGVWQRWLSQV